MENDSDFSNRMRSARISQPMESTHVATGDVLNDDRSEMRNGPPANETQDIKPVLEQIQISVNDSVMSDASSPQKKEGEPFKDILGRLNKRLLAYMDRVRNSERELAEAANAKRALEKQIKQLQSDHSEQVSLLRSELDERVRQAVIAEEKQAHLQQQLEKYKQAVENRDNALESQRLQQEELERAVVREKQATAKEARMAAEYKEALMKTHDEREHLKEECTRLKVEIAKLTERVKVASLEKTMHESKVAAVEKELLFSSQDVTAKLSEQRKQLEAVGMKKLEDMRQKHSLELKRCREELEKKLRDTLKMYVTSEDYVTLKSEAQSNLKRAEQAEDSLRKREDCIKSLRNKIEDLECFHQKTMQDEKRRRERINRRVLAQTRDLEEIRTELDVYRKLVEGLDVGNNTFCVSPMGTKRVRTSLELESPSFNLASRILSSGASTPNRVSQDSPQTSAEARKALLKRALTPRRRRSSGGDSKKPTSSSERDCMVM